MAKKPKTGKPVVPAPTGRLPCNEARGEARLFIDNVELILAAEIARLSSLSTALQCKSMNDLFVRLSGAEVTATVAGLQALTIRGDALAAIDKLKLRHFPDCASAFNAVLAHHFDGDEGNGEATGEVA